MQESFWWWQCSDRYIISLFPHFPPFFPSLISLTVSVDVEHHVYLLTSVSQRVSAVHVRTSSPYKQKQEIVGIVVVPLMQAVDLFRRSICLHFGLRVSWIGAWLKINGIVAINQFERLLHPFLSPSVSFSLFPRVCLSLSLPTPFL